MKLALNLTLMVLTTATCLKPAQGVSSARLSVHVYNFAKAPSATVARAKKEAARILKEAGIESAWIDCPLTSAEMDAVPACRETRLTNLTLRIIPEAAASLKKEMLGFALPAPEEAIHATVFYSRVRELAGIRAASEGQILGIAMAHEIGHLLLGLEKHSPAGLMRAQWSRSDLQLARVEQLRFSAQQGRTMQEEVGRRAARD